MTALAEVGRGWRFLKTLAREYEETGCDDSAAKLTYTTLFAVVPTLTVAWAVVRQLPLGGDLAGRLDGFLLSSLAPASGEQLRGQLAAFAQQAANLTGIGVVFLVVTAVMMLLTIERRINAVWRLHRERSLVSSLLVYWALLTLGPVLAAGGIASSSWLLSAELWGQDVQHHPMVVALLEALPFLVEVAFFSLLYIVVPHTHVPLREGVIGGVFAALLFELAKAGFAFFVTRFNSYELVYGAFAAVPLFLLWVYISWSITLFGVVLVYTLANWDDSAVPRAAPLPALVKVLGLFQARQAGGQPVADREARHAARLAGIDNWHVVREELLRRGIVERLATGQLVLIRDLHDLRLSELARLFPWDQLAPGAGGPEPDALAQREADRLRAALAAFDQGLDLPVADALAPPSPPQP